MHATLRFSIASVLALVLTASPLADAAQTNAEPPKLVPPQIASARTVFVSNGGGPNYFDLFSGGPNRGYSQLYADMQKWGRYELLDSPSQADLIFEIRSIAPAVEDVNQGTGFTTYNPQIILRILDPKTGAVLWTATANVRAAGRQASRDKGFDESVAVLVDRARQVAGEQLTAAQLKAVRKNSTMSRSAKILLGVAIGAAAGLSIYGIYRVTHPPTLTPPSLPAPPCSDPPFCPASAP